ncbi:MAG: protein kinase [Clostridiales bacterium]|nr:protein kinase [Clostridiales bacterium]
MTLIEKYDPAWSMVSQIGEGGFSKVYKIVKEEFGFKYYSALKVIPVPQNSSEISQLKEEGLDGDSLNTYIDAMVGDLINEINLVREFKGMTNIVGYEDHKIIPKEGEPGYTILIRMELLESLAQVFQSRKLGEEDALRVGIDICRALERLEMCKIIHRDIKPENIFLSKYGDYKLGDFGIARQIEKTLSGMSRKGTYNYMAPEVFKGQEYGATVDLYSLGIVLYRILNSGRVPFLPTNTTVLRPSDKEAAFSRRIKGEPLPPPDGASPELSRIILKACAYEHRKRYANATEMRIALEEYKLPKTSKRSIFKSPVPKPKPSPKLQEPSASDIAATVLESSVPEAEPDSSTILASAGSGVPTTILELPVSKAETELKSADDVQQPETGADSSNVLPEEMTTGVKAGEDKDNVGISDKNERSSKKLGLKICIGAAIALIAILWALGFGVAEIKGVQYSSSTETLSLSNLDLKNSDIKGLNNLSSIREINLMGNELTNTRFLSSLKHLKSLNLVSNQITDIKPLSNLKFLETLYLSDNNITDISPLSKLSSLTELTLVDNQITNIDPLSKLTNLEVLYLSGNKINDVSPLLNLSTLKTLNLRNNPLSDNQIDLLIKSLPRCAVSF